ncbi:MAG: hypothetical protein KDK70_33345 [Myxococcales bacterium]|nr:hypothetical protein [Myxococcales bacterium]
MIQARHLIGVVALGLGLGLGLGPGACTDVPSLCQTVCNALDRCKMIPGPLGDDQTGRSSIDDCEARCAVSAARGALYDCVDRKKLEASDLPPSLSTSGDTSPVGTSGAPDSELHCTTSSGASDTSSDTSNAFQPPDSTDWCDHGFCSEFASCLRSALETDAILGVGSVAVSAMSSAPPEVPMACPVTVERPDDQSFLRDLCAPQSLLKFQAADADGERTEITQFQPGQVILDLISEDFDAITVAEGDCDVLQARLVVPNVTVGTYQARLRIFGAESNDCVLFEGPVVQVKADATINATYWVDADAICVEECNGGIERPLCDGHAAAVLPTLCPEAEDYRCRDGEDNDGDGLVDCDDLDCEASGVCDGSLTSVTTTTGTATDTTTDTTADSSSG